MYIHLYHNNNLNYHIMKNLDLRKEQMLNNISYFNPSTLSHVRVKPFSNEHIALLKKGGYIYQGLSMVARTAESAVMRRLVSFWLYKNGFSYSSMRRKY